MAVLSSSSGVPDDGSLCRQFWTWLGLTRPYDPSQIKFTVVYSDNGDNPEAIHLSLPNLTQFEVLVNPFSRRRWAWPGSDPITFDTEYLNSPQPRIHLQFEVKSDQGALATVVTLETSTQGDPKQLLTARTIMTDDYPPTAFKSCDWDDADVLPPNVLIYIEAEVVATKPYGPRSPHLHIMGFYSKAADQVAAKTLTDEEMVTLRGAGRRLLCQVLDTVPVVQTVNLVALGVSARDKKDLTAVSEGMQAADIMSDLQQLNHNIYRAWAAIRNPDTRPLENLRNEWVIIRANWRLVDYYKRNFGFEHTVMNSFTGVSMTATSAVIRQHCAAASRADGGDVIVSREAKHAASQMAALEPCRTIHRLSFHDVTSLRNLTSLDEIQDTFEKTAWLGLLGETSVSKVSLIAQVLAAHPRLKVQIDCLCLDSADWSWLADVMATEAWPRWYIRRVVVRTVERTEAIYDDVMRALGAKTTAIYHTVERPVKGP
jgi:hypothetical protein